MSFRHSAPSTDQAFVENPVTSSGYSADDIPVNAMDGTTDRVIEDTAVANCNFSGDDTAVEDTSDLATTTVQVVEDEKKKKNRSKRSNKNKPTGFEEYYCEPVMTPAEYDEEKTVIYAAGRPFVDRIEECIQRYRARRRMDVDRNKLFTEYLTLGGIDCSVRQFQSANKITDDMLLESSKSAIREMIADDVIIRTGDSTYCRYYNPNNPEHWDVDFTGVASAFLSDHVLRQAGNDISMVAMAADVVGNFLRYVVQHDVCPEHAEDIDNALKVCDRAVEEAVCIEDITQALPSNFCSALRFLKCIGDKDKEQMSDIFRRKDEQHAVVTVGCAALMWLPVLEKAIHRQQEWHVVDTSTHTYEVCNIRLSTDEMKSKLADLNRSLRYPKRKICAVFTARRAVVPDGWDQTGTAIPEEDKGEVEFVIEEAVVKNLKPGMKLTLVVCTTSLGWKFIKRIEDVKPSYYLFIPQELMITFKEPVFVDLSGPSIWSAQGFDINDVPIGDKDVV